MTKTEARRWMRRIREDLRDLDFALSNTSHPTAALTAFDAISDALGAISEIHGALCDGYGDGRTLAGLSWGDRS